MKKIAMMLMMFLMAGTLNVMAQSVKQEKKKQAKAELKEKASKAARDEAKRLKKEGWTVFPGALPLEMQLDRSYLYQLEVDEDMNPLYIIGNAQSIGENTDAARIQATELSRVDIAGKIGSETTAKVDNMVGNKQLSAEEAATITTILMEDKTIISQKLGRLLPAVEIYRTLKNKNKEVMIRLAMKESAVREMVKNHIRGRMEEKGQKMSDELDAMLSNGR